MLGERGGSRQIWWARGRLVLLWRLEECSEVTEGSLNRVEHAHSTMNTRRAAMMRRDQAGSGGSWGQEGLGQVLGIPGAH